MDEKPLHMGGDVKAGKEADQKAAVPFTLILLDCSESSVCQHWPQISPADPNGTRQVI